MKVGVPLMKYVPIPLPKSVLIPSRLTVSESAADVDIHKINSRLRNHNIDNFKWRNGRYNENS